MEVTERRKVPAVLVEQRRVRDQSDESNQQPRRGPAAETEKDPKQRHENEAARRRLHEHLSLGEHRQ
jgi:hypothetical protein